MRTVAAALAVLIALPAQADPLALYRAGRYAQAIEEASRQNSASGFALAARAALADAMTRAPCMDCLKRAEALARKAVAADDRLADAHVYLAVTLGYESRILGVVRARLNSWPEEARRNLDAALALEPRNATALAARGGWNIEVVRGGGAVLAGMVYGASAKKGLDDFAAAFAAAPDNPVLRYQYALSLGGLDLDAYRDKIGDALARAAKAEPQTAYEKLAQSRAAELLATLRRGDRAQFDALVRRDQGYP